MKNFMKKLILCLMIIALCLPMIDANVQAATKCTCDVDPDYCYLHDYFYHPTEENRQRQITRGIQANKEEALFNREKRKTQLDTPNPLDELTDIILLDECNHFERRYNDWEDEYFGYKEEGLLDTLTNLRKPETIQAWKQNLNNAVLGLETPHQVSNSKSTSGKHGTYLYVGNTFDLKVTGGSGVYTYKSSKSKVASVSSNGIVTAKKKGTTTISIYDNKTTRTKKYYVNVRPKSEKKKDYIKNTLYEAVYKDKKSVTFNKKKYSKKFITKVMYFSGYSNPKLVYNNMEPWKANIIISRHPKYSFKETKNKVTIKIKYNKKEKKVTNLLKKAAKACKGATDIETIANVVDYMETKEGQAYTYKYGLKYINTIVLAYNKLDSIVIAGTDNYIIDANGSVVYFDGGWYSQMRYSSAQYKIMDPCETDSSYYNTHYIKPKCTDSEGGGFNFETYKYLLKGTEVGFPYYLPKSSQSIDYEKNVNLYSDIKLFTGGDRYIDKRSYALAKYFVDAGWCTWKDVFNQYRTHFSKYCVGYECLDALYSWRNFTKKGYIDPIEASGMTLEELGGYVNPFKRTKDRLTYLNSLANQ